jgi:enoyl-CoA hydratase
MADDAVMVRYERDGDVTTITLARQPVNAYDGAFHAEFQGAWQRAKSDDSRVVVMKAEGKHFCVGANLRNPQPAPPDAVILHAWDEIRLIQGVMKPTIAAVQGGCIGGGVDMISACDMRYATADAFFCIQEINIGMTADVGTLQRLPRIVPEGVVRELAYTGRRMSAARAREVGLVNEVFADHTALLDGVLQIADEIAHKSPLAIWGSKEMINYARDHSVADSLNYIATWQTGMFQPGDMMESFAARTEKRAPRFSDLLPAPRKL